MSARNPNHPVVIQAESQWHKLCAILLHKSGSTEAQITAADVDALTNSGIANIVIHAKKDMIVLRLVSDAEGARLAREHGGLPI